MATVAGRVIVIEDDQGMREAIESLLGAAGCAVLAYDSVEALLRAGVPPEARCVVSDIRLGGMSGFDLSDELQRRGVGLPLILITANDSPTMRRQAEQCGAAAYLSKPFAAAALLEAVAQAGGAGTA